MSKFKIKKPEIQVGGTITASLGSDLKSKLEKEAKSAGVSVSEALRQIVGEFFGSGGSPKKSGSGEKSKKKKASGGPKKSHKKKASGGPTPA